MQKKHLVLGLAVAAVLALVAYSACSRRNASSDGDNGADGSVEIIET